MIIKSAHIRDWDGNDFIRYISLRLSDRGIMYMSKSYVQDIITVNTILKWAYLRQVTNEYLVSELDKILDSIISKRVTSLNFLPRYFKKIKPTVGRSYPDPKPPAGPIEFSDETKCILKQLKLE